MPLEPHVAVRPYVVALVGVRKYLRFKQTPKGLSFAEAAYIFKEKSSNAVPPQPPHAFFATFTGMLLVKDFATGETSDFAFKDDIRQPFPGVPGSKGSNRTTFCYTTVTCAWSGYCGSEPGGEAMVFGATTYGLGSCTAPGDDGVGCSRIVWKLDRTNTDQHCSPDGSGDPGGDPNGGGGCTNCGPSGPTGPTPPTNLNSPCGKMYTLGNQPYIKQASSNLIGLMGQNGEFGYAYRNNGLNGNDYEFRQSANFNNPANSSEDDRRSIRWNQLPWPLDGLMHTHPPGSYTIFSISDLQAMYLLKRNNQMVDPATFTNFVFTASGDDYALKITNLNDFIDFGGTIATNDGIIEFETRWLNTDPGKYNVSASNSLAANEQAFLRLLKERKTGLTMFKHDRNSDNWQQRDVDANKTPVNIPCQ